MKKSNTQENIYAKDEKFYQEEHDKFYKDIDDNTIRIVENKICIVDESKYCFPNFASTLENNMRNEEDFFNFHLSYANKETILSDKRKIKVYYLVDNKNRVNKVQCFFARTLSEFLDIISKIESLDNCKHVYRGHDDWKYDLVPSIYRKGNEKILKNEAKYIRDFIASYPQFFEECNSALDYLAVLQHYGFPTRLLDFTENPLVALYMACNNKKSNISTDKDVSNNQEIDTQAYEDVINRKEIDSSAHGDVIRVDLKEDYYKYYDSDTVSILSNIAFLDNIDVSNFKFDEYKELFDFPTGYSYNRYGQCINKEAQDEMIDSFNNRIDIQRLIHNIRNEKPHFMPKIDPQHLDNMLLIVKPRQRFKRLVLQSGLFGVFGINKEKEQPAKFESQNLEFRITHIIIPDECKENILKELDTLHINRATLYGDMDNIVAHYLDTIKNN